MVLVLDGGANDDGHKVSSAAWSVAEIPIEDRGPKLRRIPP